MRSLALLALVLGQVIGPERPLENIAPGQSGFGWARTCDNDTNACLLEWDQGDDSNATLTDLLPIPHGARITVQVLDAAECTCAVITDPNGATTTMIGDQTTPTTAMEVFGARGATFGVDGEGDDWTEVINWWALREVGLAPRGVCDLPTTNEAFASYRLHGVCANNADCASIGGHGAGAVCIGDGNGEFISTVLGDPLMVSGELPAVYAACRCSPGARVKYWVTL